MRSDELYHYGVKGMKWGVRKERYTSGRRIGAYDPDNPQSRKDYRRLNAALAIGAGAGALYGMYKRRSFNPNDSRKFVRALRTASPVITGAAGAIGAGGVAAGYNQLRDKIISNALKKNRAGAYRTLADGRIAPNGKVTKVTRGVIDDYNNMDEKAFRGKYAASKRTYLRRLSKYDDPYKHAKNSSWYKAAKKISKPMLERRAKIRKAMNWTYGDDWQEPGVDRIGKRRR